MGNAEQGCWVLKVAGLNFGDSGCGNHLVIEQQTSVAIVSLRVNEVRSLLISYTRINCVP